MRKTSDGLTYQCGVSSPPYNNVLVSAKWISANDNDVHDVYSDAAQAAVESGNRNIVDIFSIHSASNDTGSFSLSSNATCICRDHLFTQWKIIHQNLLLRR